MVRALFLASDVAYQLRETRLWAAKASFYLDFLGSRGIRTRFMVSPHYPSSNRLRHKELIRVRLRFHVAVGLLMFRPKHVSQVLKDVTRLGLLPTLRTQWLLSRVDWFQAYFEKTKVDVLLGIGLAEPELRAAKNLGIQCFEFQHGRVTQVALERGFSADARPNFYVCWFDSDCALIELFGMQALPLGPPWQTSPVGRLVPTPRSQRVLLVVLQYGFDKEIDVAGSCHVELARCLQAVRESHPSLTFRFRAHPVLTRRRQRKVFSQLASMFPGSSFHYSHDIGIFESFHGVTACLSYSSSSWIESFAANVPWYLVEDWSRNDARQHLQGYSLRLALPSFEELQSHLQNPYNESDSLKEFQADLGQLESFFELVRSKSVDQRASQAEE